MSNSSLVDYTRLSPNRTAPRSHAIDKITIHHMAGNLSVETCGNVFQNTSRQASSNYGVGTDGRIGLYVDESRRAWTSSNRDNDNVAVTIEVANDGGAPDWHVSDKALESTIALCVDICKRNGIQKLNFTGDKTGNLTMHKWFANTLCPGPYLESKFPHIANEVNRRLSNGQKENSTTDTPQTVKPDSSGTVGVTYRVQVGAYSKKEYAEKQLVKIKAAGFEDAYIAVVDNTLYRVQVGAYSEKANAEAQLAKVIHAGFSGFVTKLSGTVEPVNGIKPGSVVMVKGNAPDYTGTPLAPFVYERKHMVKQIDGERAVIVYNGVVVAAVHVNNLFLVP
jgi:hypothetical protein